MSGIDCPWHALSGDACLERLGASAAGLSPGEVAARRERYGANVLPRAKQPSLPLLFLRQFRSPLIYLLLGAAGISFAIGHGSDAGFILVVLLINAVIGTVQEGRAGASAEALRALVHQIARVRRAGDVAEIDAAELVPGDVVLVETGGCVPADMLLLDAAGLTANESLLTGEALPVDKSAGPVLPAEASPADRTNMLHAGTTIAEGRGVGVVVATGTHTELGKIGASLLGAPTEPPPIVLQLQRLARQIAVGTLGLILVLAVALGATGTPAGEIFLLAVALAVSAIPEGLPIAVTVALSAATFRMAQRNVIVRTLPAVEGLGACTLIATDKTGTLTLNRLSVEAVLLASGERVGREDWQTAAVHPALAALAEAAALCNEAARSPDGAPVGDSVDVALLRFADAIDGEGHGRAERAALFAYEPSRRFASVAVHAAGGLTVYAKGAVETVAAMCDAPPAGLLGAAEALADRGYRVLALARGRVDALEAIDLADPHGLELIGCVGLLDPLRPEAAEAIRQCREAAIEVRMITGDHPATARTIARQLGLADGADDVVTGAELAALGEGQAFDARVALARVFARTEPAQKLAIVQALQRLGHVVAVTGDGVNDAPALQAASIGVAMGQGGTDVARAAADLILTDDNFASIVAGVEEGRITYANLRKIAVFLLASGIAEIGMFLVALAAGLPMPLTAVQLLWCNLATNGAQDVMLGFGKGEGDELRRPPRRKGARLVDGPALALIVPPALAMTLLAVLVLGWSLGRGAPLAETQSLVLLAVVLFQNVFVLSVRSERRPIWHEPAGNNRWLLVGVTAALTLQLVAMTFAPLAGLLGTGLPDAEGLAVCLGAAMLVLVVSEATKAVVRRAG